MKNVLIVVLVTVFACFFSTSTIGQELNVPFDLKLGQQVTVLNTGLTIKFKSVDNDSRCPEGAKCIMPGNAKVTIIVSKKEISLNTFVKPKESRYSNYTLQLVDLIPHRRLETEIDPKDYVVRLIVTKN